MEKAISDKTIFKLTIPNLIALVSFTILVYSTGNTIITSVFTVGTDLKQFKESQELFNKGMENRMIITENKNKVNDSLTAKKLNNFDEKLTNIERLVIRNSPYNQSSISQN